MQEFQLYKDIQARTGGEIYIGVVGPVRTGKSTFIRRFMEQMVLPGQSGHEQEMTRDELPTSGIGKTITTVEPKFVPRKAASVRLGDEIQVNLRMVDCVGYVIDGAEGYSGENGAIRMVKTPWEKKEIPFTDAAAIGTDKVIREHATVGIVITTDGSFGELPRENFLEAEKKAILELKKIGKPFLVLVNSEKPFGDPASRAVAYIESMYQASCMAVNCEQLKKEDILQIFEKLLYEFPVVRLEFYVPKWLEMLNNDHWMKQELLGEVHRMMEKVHSIKDITPELLQMDKPFIKRVKLDRINLAQGLAEVSLEPDESYYYGILSEITGIHIEGEYQLISILKDLSVSRKEYESVEDAVRSVRLSGYGIITPKQEEITLEEPELIKQGSKYGVKIRASSPSIHLIRADIETEIAPIVGSETQAQDLIDYIKDSKDQEAGIWKTNIFGKSVEQLVMDGIQGKLAMIGEESQQKLQDTMRRIVNESNGGLICIII
ncbi:MAG: stage IV sporulation protein A [Lachnospiraceae bacterium]|nr:stage IV sporulation protein A [Lachnospiraceae bacterium]